MGDIAESEGDGTIFPPSQSRFNKFTQLDVVSTSMAIVVATVRTSKCAVHIFFHLDQVIG